MAVESALRQDHIERMVRRKLPGADLLRRLNPRYGRKGTGRLGGEEGEPALVEPNKPKPLVGGAAAPLDEESA